MKLTRRFIHEYSNIFLQRLYVLGYEYVDSEGRTHVVFEDATHLHKGMSITNSAEQAINAYLRDNPEPYAFYETYGFESFDQIFYEEGQNVSWERSKLIFFR